MNQASLRFGNLVYVINRTHELHIAETDPVKIGDVKLFECTVYDIYKPVYRQNPRVLDLSDIVEISLTADWMRKFGYIRISGESDKDALWEFKSKDSFHQVLEESGRFSCDIREIKNVHELQNVFYFDNLTGEELTIK